MLFRFSLLLAFLFCTFSEAQNNKAKDIRYRVQVQELASESPDWNDLRAMFTEKVATNLKLTNRANVFLAKSKDAVKSTIAESFDATNVDTWVYKSAQDKVKYTVHGSINSLKYIKIGNSGYKASIVFTVRIIDNESDETVAQQEFTSKKSDIMISRSAALPAALKTTDEAQKSFFKSFFNLRTTILKFDKSNKKAVSELTITAGSSSGLKKGNELIVKQIEEVDGFEVETEVGVLKVTEPGTRTSKCKVSKGGKEILQLFDKNNRESLICELKTK